MVICKTFLSKVKNLGEGTHYCGLCHGWISISSLGNVRVFELSNPKRIGAKGSIKLYLRPDPNNSKMYYFSTHKSNGVYFCEINEKDISKHYAKVLLKKVNWAYKFKTLKKSINKVLISVWRKMRSLHSSSYGKRL